MRAQAKTPCICNVPDESAFPADMHPHGWQQDATTRNPGDYALFSKAMCMNSDTSAQRVRNHVFSAAKALLRARAFATRLAARRNKTKPRGKRIIFEWDEYDMKKDNMLILALSIWGGCWMVV